MSYLLRRNPASSSSPDADRSVAPVSHLGKSLTVTGQLETDGELHVDGRVVGQINADRIVVGISGFVEGDVRAKDVRIIGKLNGRIYATNVALDSSAQVAGRVFHTNISVATGARIDGRMPWRPVNFFESLTRIPEE
jgi:cytoskeletal protein CcmA (bactofilin family)